ncbi:MAG: hypothetical protein JST30_08120 [Armatimonadetes bacterium]|nr:hypothetical protein [Armatimonadota bacterium]
MTPSISINVLREDGPASLGPVLGEGGEGAVYRVTDRPSLAAKVYRHPDDDRAAKLLELVTLDGDRLRQAGAWPQSVLRNEDGAIVGFEMALLDEWVPLFRVYQSGSRMRLLPRASFTFLVRAARNLATCVHYVHEAGLVIGDLNESNVLVDARGMVRIIDVDSFQVGAFSCRVGKSELTPPELQDRSMADAPRTIESDRFALAVLLFQTLVFGRHPFSGASSDGSEATLEERIAAGHYAWAQRRDVPVRPPLGLNLSWLPPEIGALFERAFDLSVADRPSALEWYDALLRLEAETAECPDRSGHVFWSGADGCPWCRLEEAWKVPLFSSGRHVRERKSAPTPDVTSLWADVASVRAPFLVPPPVLQNYDETHPSKLAWFENQRWASLLGVIFMFNIGGSSIARVAVSVAVIAVVCGLVIYGHQRRLKSGLPVPKAPEFKALVEELNALVPEWSDVAQTNYAEKMQELADVRSRLADRAGREALLQSEVYFARRPGETQGYLSKFAVVSSGLVTEKNRPVLAAAQIRTAADLDEHRLAKVAGLDARTCKGLLDWKSTLCGHYFSTCAKELTDEENEAVERKLRSEEAMLAQRLRSAPAELEELKERLVTRQRELATEVQPLLDRYEALAPRFHAYVKAGLIKVDKPWTYYVDHGPKTPTLRVSKP